jgi:hypothetical protein
MCIQYASAVSCLIVFGMTAGRISEYIDAKIPCNKRGFVVYCSVVLEVTGNSAAGAVDRRESPCDPFRLGC